MGVNRYTQVDSLSMLGVCVGAAAVPVEPAAVDEGLVPGLEVEVLPA